jgi:bifunctional DNA-binding transcriptional regulator/antitoxin component of YhaV-PrlF toxin-antitoxin module
MGGMASPQKVRVDKQGRLVLPQQVRDELVDVPGEVLLERTAEGILLRPVRAAAHVRIAEDGLPVLDIDGVVSNDEVLAEIARARLER